MNFFHHNDLGNHLLQLCPKVVKHPVYIYLLMLLMERFNPKILLIEKRLFILDEIIIKNLLRNLLWQFLDAFAKVLKAIIT